MPTRSFHNLLQEQIAGDPGFAEALLREAIEALLAGDVDSGKAILRDYIKATAGFEKLGKAIGIPAKSLIRMFGPRGNPQARNLFGTISYLQKIGGLRVQVVIEAELVGKSQLQPRGRATRRLKPRKGKSALPRRRAA